MNRSLTLAVVDLRTPPSIVGLAGPAVQASATITPQLVPRARQNKRIAVRSPKPRALPHDLSLDCMLSGLSSLAEEAAYTTMWPGADAQHAFIACVLAGYASTPAEVVTASQAATLRARLDRVDAPALKGQQDALKREIKAAVPAPASLSVANKFAVFVDQCAG